MTPNTVAVEPTVFDECNVILTVLQLFELINFVLKKKKYDMHVCHFPKICFKQMLV